jgi:hypothetical protein
MAANIESSGNGSWSNPGTWAGSVIPGAGDTVKIRAGHTVTYDAHTTAIIDAILVNGTLTFHPFTNTLLEAGQIVISSAPDFDFFGSCSPMAKHEDGHMMVVPKLHVGTPARSIADPSSATIRLHATAGADLTCAPGIINHGGEMHFHGAPITPTWTKLVTTAAAGQTVIQLSQATDWKIGDQLLIPGTLKPSGRTPGGTIRNGANLAESERRFISAISPDGMMVTLDQPLKFPHKGGANEGDNRGEVANLSRNVVIESADPTGPARGHTMYHAGSKGSISYAEFRHLGKKGILGRYPIHFHLVQSTMRGSYVQGASIWDSANRWLVIHGAEYLVVRDTVGFNSLGPGFFLENGTEVYNLLAGNLGVQAHVTEPIPNQALAYDRNHGACYWAANARNFIYGNTFVECDNDDSFILDYAPNDNPMLTEVLQPDGSRQIVDIRRMSGGLIKDLEVHSHWGWGPWIVRGRYPEDEPLVFENTHVWNTHYSIDISGDNVVFDGVKVTDTSYGFYNLYPGPHLVKNATMVKVSPHGAFMTYRGGHGTFLYDDIKIESSRLVFRMNAKTETGANGEPIQIHARNVTVLNPVFTDRSGRKRAAWIGTESNAVRADPLLMFVHHDLFGSDADGVFLPLKQSTAQLGIPPGLTFVRAHPTRDDNGVSLEGRGDIQYAMGNVPWPSSPLENPVDRVPPATIILAPQRNETVSIAGDALEVCGVAVDQFGIASVQVNGVEATVDRNGYDWCATLTGLSQGPLEITAVATDNSGHVELTPHVITADICPSGQCLGSVVLPPVADAGDDQTILDIDGDGMENVTGELIPTSIN